MNQANKLVGELIDAFKEEYKFFAQTLGAIDAADWMNARFLNTEAAGTMVDLAFEVRKLLIENYELKQALYPDEPVEPEPDPDEPDVPVEPDPDPDPAYPEPELPTIEELLAEPPFPVPHPPAYGKQANGTKYNAPTEDELDWIITGNADGSATAQSLKGLGTFNQADGNAMARAYKMSYAAGHIGATQTPKESITFGIKGNGGKVWPGGQYSKTNGYSIAIAYGQTYAEISIRIVGMTDDAEVELGWSKRWGFAKRIEVHKIGLRGGSDSFVIRANEGIGTFIADGFWYLPGKKAVYKKDAEGKYVLDGQGNRIVTGYVDQNYSSGIHIDNWETMILRDKRFRGKNPSDPGMLVKEHQFYPKSCIASYVSAGTWILCNDLLGGNRTGFQIRPERLHDDGTEGNAEPKGPVVVAGNHSDGLGWTHGDTAATEDGGGVITVWASPNGDVYVFSNECVDSRYSNFIMSSQKLNRNYLNEEGFPIKGLKTWNNTFENARSKRSNVKLSSIGNIDWHEQLMIDGKPGKLVAFDDDFSMQLTGIRNGEIRVHGAEALEELRSYVPRTYDVAADKMVNIDDDVIDGWLVESGS